MNAEIAARIGGMLADDGVGTAGAIPEAERVFGDQTVFDQLRLDPYYRTHGRATSGSQAAVRTADARIVQPAREPGAWRLEPEEFPGVRRAR